MDLWRIEEASISHLVWILCIPDVFWRTFVKQTSLYHVILLIKIQGVLLLKMDLWRIEEAFISSWCHIKYEGPILWYLMRFSGEKRAKELLQGKTLKISGTYLTALLGNQKIKNTPSHNLPKIKYVISEPHEDLLQWNLSWAFTFDFLVYQEGGAWCCMKETNWDFV